MSTDLTLQTPQTPQTTPQVHVVYDGLNRDVTFADLDIGDLSTDAEVRQALARYFEVPPSKFANHAVERHSPTSYTVRPQAVFGL